MKKMPTLYVRDWDGDRSRVTRQVTPGCEWVLQSERERHYQDIWATKKFDGTCVLIGQPSHLSMGRSVFGDGCNYWKRYDAKHGKTPPPDFAPAQPNPDPETGHWPGWVPVNKHDKWHLDALVRQDIFSENLDGHLTHEELEDYFTPGTYELCGPKVSGNPENLEHHVLFKHGTVRFHGVPTDGINGFDNLRYWLSLHNIEGLVFYRNNDQPTEDWDRGVPNITMCKIKKSDFGLPRKPDPEITNQILKETLEGPKNG